MNRKGKIIVLEWDPEEQNKQMRKVRLLSLVPLTVAAGVYLLENFSKKIIN